jgi:hypothetical protein
MCKIVEKPVLVCGAGLQIIGYYCSTGGRRMRVVNGNERGGPLQEIKRVFKDNPSLKESMDPDEDFYLDHLSGDYYQY